MLRPDATIPDLPIDDEQEDPAISITLVSGGKDFIVENVWCTWMFSISHVVTWKLS
jgi:hypothetical protein